jgi:hypothetical protein
MKAVVTPLHPLFVAKVTEIEDPGSSGNTSD